MIADFSAGEDFQNSLEGEDDCVDHGKGQIAAALDREGRRWPHVYSYINRDTSYLLCDQPISCRLGGSEERRREGGNFGWVQKHEDMETGG